MAGVTKVNGHVSSDQFFGRDIVGITVTPGTTAPAEIDGKIKWAELDEAVQAIETICTVSMVGIVVASTSTVTNILIEGVAPGAVYVLADGTTPATIFTLLAELTGMTLVEFVI